MYLLKFITFTKDEVFYIHIKSLHIGAFIGACGDINDCNNPENIITVNFDHNGHKYESESCGLLYLFLLWHFHSQFNLSLLNMNK